MPWSRIWASRSNSPRTPARVRQGERGPLHARHGPVVLPRLHPVGASFREGSHLFSFLSTLSFFESLAGLPRTEQGIFGFRRKDV